MFVILFFLGENGDKVHSDENLNVLSSCVVIIYSVTPLNSVVKLYLGFIKENS